MRIFSPLINLFNSDSKVNNYKETINQLSKRIKKEQNKNIKFLLDTEKLHHKNKNLKLDLDRLQKQNENLTMENSELRNRGKNLEKNYSELIEKNQIMREKINLQNSQPSVGADINNLSSRPEGQTKVNSEQENSDYTKYIKIGRSAGIVGNREIIDEHLKNIQLNNTDYCKKMTDLSDHAIKSIKRINDQVSQSKESSIGVLEKLKDISNEAITRFVILENILMADEFPEEERKEHFRKYLDASLSKMKIYEEKIASWINQLDQLNKGFEINSNVIEIKDIYRKATDKLTESNKKGESLETGYLMGKNLVDGMRRMGLDVPNNG